MLNKKSGFWIRFSARMLDLIVVAGFVVVSAYLMMSHEGGWHFKSSWMYYVWSLEFITLLFGWFILAPALFDGRTLFMWMLGIKIIFNDENTLKSMIKRELFFSMNWIFMTILVAIVINHTLITDYSKTNLTKQDKDAFTSWETARISTVSAVGSILMVFQFIYAISIFVRGSKKGLHDSQSNTWTVWNKKFVEEVKEVKKDKIRPRPVNNNPVVWVD